MYIIRQLYTIIPVLVVIAAATLARDKSPEPFLLEVFGDTIRPHSSLAFSPDGQQMIWSGYIVGQGRTEYMFACRRDSGRWSAPERLSVNGGLGNGPAFGPDDSRLYFGTNRRLETDGPVFTGIWYVDRTQDGWSDVQPVTSTLDTTGFAGRPSLAKNGNLYFVARGTRSEMPAIFCAKKLMDGTYAEPELLSAPFSGEIVMDPWISPDESFLLLMCDQDMNERPSHGSSDLFVAHRHPEGNWGEPITLGSEINTEHFDRSPSMSLNGDYLIFIRAVGDMFVESDAHYYQVSAEILDKLRPQ